MIVADADFDPSATLVALTVTLVADVTTFGDVYTPYWLTAPGPDTTDQVTALLFAPATVAVSWFVCEGYIEELPADTLTATGTSVTVPEADLLASATLVAITLIFC